MSFKAVVFDFGNVIAGFSDRSFTDSLAEYCPRSSESLYTLIYKNTDIKREYEMGKLSSDEFYQKILDLTGAVIEKEDFIRIYTDIFHPVPGTLSLIRRLKPNYKLGLLSNTSEWDYEFGIKSVEVFPLFDAVTVSYELKLFKPDPAIYFDILEKLSLCPGDCIYIDDIKEYSEAASGIGMTGIHYQDPDGLETSMRELGIRL